jgi:hypothetical protein
MGLYRVDEMESLIRAMLRAPSQEHFTSADFLRAVNDAYKDVSSRAFCIEREDIIRTVPGSRLVPFSGHRVNNVLYTSQSGASSVFVERTGPVEIDQYFYGIAYGNGVYCICGTHAGALKIYISQDLDNWTSWVNPTPNITDIPFNIAWNGTVFCVALWATKVITSPDGVNWTPRALHGYYTHFKDITFANRSLHRNIPQRHRLDGPNPCQPSPNDDVCGCLWWWNLGSGRWKQYEHRRGPS